VYFLTRSDLTARPAIPVTMTGVLIVLACFSLFNVAFRRPWRCPGLCFATVIAMFVVGIASGQ